MATNELEKMRAIARETWPKVRADIEEQMRRASITNRHVGGIKRRVSEQTVLQLVRDGLVCTPAERAVIEAARSWVAAEGFAAECLADDVLLEAVERLE